MTTSASPKARGPTRKARRRPSPKAASPISPPTGRDTRPAGIGLPGLCPASRGASTMSLIAPIPSWRAVIARPSSNPTRGIAPARIATLPLTTPSRIDGKGWVRRTAPTIRAPMRGRGSDVDELAEVGDEVLDQSGATVGDLRADPRDESEERDG